MSLVVLYCNAVQYCKMGDVHAVQKRTVTVRVEEREVEAWREAAHIRHDTLSGWMRKVLNATAAATKEAK